MNIGSRGVRFEASEFKGKVLVHIRQWYEKDGKTLPGKGIALTPEEWSEILSNAQNINEEIEKLCNIG